MYYMTVWADKTGGLGKTGDLHSQRYIQGRKKQTRHYSRERALCLLQVFPEILSLLAKAREKLVNILEESENDGMSL